MPDVTNKQPAPTGRRSESTVVRNELQAIERIRKARELKDQMGYFKDKGYTLNAAIKIETQKFLQSEQARNFQNENDQGEEEGEEPVPEHHSADDGHAAVEKQVIVDSEAIDDHPAEAPAEIRLAEGAQNGLLLVSPVHSV
jgi:hypothetical protein